MSAMKTHPELEMDRSAFKESEGSAHDFSGLQVMECKEIVSLGIPPGSLKSTEGGVHLTPEQFHKYLNPEAVNPDEPVPPGLGKGSRTILIDCRNAYEWKVGRFKNAILPPTRQFSDWPKFADNLIDELKLASGGDPSTKGVETRAQNTTPTAVMMYCTGGIRCERGSAYLKSRGVQHVYQLKVHHDLSLP
mmetsp:Transcript_6119/g.11180  ORF Transcript_6119/g.11180 Transcript_6119/m.11180 type:complete len:191 (+) Transcript_6119:623-1195(+)